MPNKITVRRLVSILKRAPEKRFRIIELAPQLLDEAGQVDIVKAMDAQADINLAITEVQSYITASTGLRLNLEYLATRTAAAITGDAEDADEDFGPDDPDGGDE